MAKSMQWQDMTPRQRQAVSAVGVVEAALTLYSLIDLVKRPADEVRGPKAAWAAGVFVQPVGPVLYLLWGRRGG